LFANCDWGASFGYAAYMAGRECVSRRMRVPGIASKVADDACAARIAASRAPGSVAADDVNAFDAAFEGALGGFELQDHAARDGAILDEGFDFVACDGRRLLFLPARRLRRR